MLTEIEREEHHGVEGPANINTNALEKDHVDAKAEEVPTPVRMEEEESSVNDTDEKIVEGPDVRVDGFARGNDGMRTVQQRIMRGLVMLKMPQIIIPSIPGTSRMSIGMLKSFQISIRR